MAMPELGEFHRLTIMPWLESPERRGSGRHDSKSERSVLILIANFARFSQ